MLLVETGQSSRFIQSRTEFALAEIQSVPAPANILTHSMASRTRPPTSRRFAIGGEDGPTQISESRRAGSAGLPCSTLTVDMTDSHLYASLRLTTELYRNLLLCELAAEGGISFIVVPKPGSRRNRVFFRESTDSPTEPTWLVRGVSTVRAIAIFGYVVKRQAKYCCQLFPIGCWSPQTDTDFPKANPRE